MQFLQEQIQCQCQKGGVLIFSTVAGHQQQKKNYQQVRGIKVLWQKVLQKSGNTVITAGILRFWMPLWNSSGFRKTGGSRGRRADRRFFHWRRTRLWFRSLVLYGLTRYRIRNSISSVSTVRLGNITVIQSSHLPPNI